MVLHCVKVFGGCCRMRVKKLPHVLALHLKRFKLEQPNRSIKLSYRVVFPLELRLFNTVVAMSYLFILCRIKHSRILQFTDRFLLNMSDNKILGGRVVSIHSRLPENILTSLYRSRCYAI